jgi:signal transduction histidine kinase
MRSDPTKVGRSTTEFPANADLVCRRQAIRRGLARSNTATLVALLISVGLAVATVFYAFEAQQANERTREELWKAQRARAMALRLSAKVGRCQEGLKAIAEAVRIRPSPELRDEAIATLPLVDVQPGTFWQALPPEDTVLAISFQRDLYAIGHVNGRVSIRQMTNQADIGAFELLDRVMCLEFSPDGRWLAAHSKGGSLYIWDAVRCQTIQQHHLPAGDFNEHSLTFTPDNKQVAVCAPGEIVRIFDLSTGQENEPIPVRAPPVVAIFDATGQSLAVGVRSRIQIWDAATRQLRQTLEVGEHVNDLAWHPLTRHFAVATRNGRVVLVSPEGLQLQSLTGHTALVNRVFFDPSGEVLVSTSWDGTTRFWSAHSGLPLLANSAGFARQFDLSGQRLFYTKEGAGFGDWQFTSGTAFHTLALPRDAGIETFSVDFSPDDRWLAVAALDGVHVWDYRNRRPLGIVRLPYAGGAAFANDGKSLVVRSAAGLHQVPCRFDPNRDGIEWGEPVLMARLFSPLFEQGFATRGSRRWFVAGNASNVAIVDLAHPEQARLMDLPGDGSSMGVSPDGRLLVTSYWKGRGTRVWPLDQPASVRKLGDEGGLAVFSPDGRRLVVGTGKRFNIYDTADWRLQREITRDTASALSGVTAFHPDGRTMAVTHTLRQIRLLDTANGHTLATLDAPTPERITALCFSRDGTTLAAATGNAEVHLWNLAELRHGLQGLGMDLNAEGSLSGQTVGNPLLSSGPGHTLALWFSGLSASLALLFALYNIRHHRRLVYAYEAVEIVAEDRRREVEVTQLHLMHSQKMKALGTLATGIAHDFNNLLSIIRMSGQLLARQVEPHQENREELDAIEQAVAQGKRIVRSILGYSRHTGSALQRYSVASLVSESLAMLSPGFLSGIVLTLELDSETPLVQGEPSRLEQILLNLVVNAAEAMQGQGKLCLMVREQPTAGSCLLAPRPAPRYVEMVVRDSGPGIAAGDLPRIFEPFYSTKKSGDGLGLTTVYTIVEQDGLGLDVTTEGDVGTPFRVLIPVATEPASPVGTAPA